MKHGISMSRFVLLFSYVILLAHASAETPGGLNHGTVSPRQPHRSRTGARLYAATAQYNQSQTVKSVDSADEDIYTYNSAGAWQQNLPEGSTGTFNAVSAQWQVPAVSIPTPGSKEYWQVCSYVGIDGADICNDVLFQAGVTTYAALGSNGALNTWVYAFAEFLPDPPVEVSLDVKVGDVIQVKLQLVEGSLTKGLAEFVNLNTGATSSLSLVAPAGKTLCGKTASWLVENVKEEDGKTRTPYPQFLPYHFTNCVAGTTDNLTIDLAGAKRIIMTDDDGAIISTPYIISDEEVDVIYGPPT